MCTPQSCPRHACRCITISLFGDPLVISLQPSHPGVLATGLATPPATVHFPPLFHSQFYTSMAGHASFTSDASSAGDLASHLVRDTNSGCLKVCFSNELRQRCNALSYFCCCFFLCYFFCASSYAITLLCFFRVSTIMLYYR